MTAIAEVLPVSSQADLVRSAARGDALAFERLLATRADGAFRIARAMLGDESEARDATQEAFVSAWRELPRLRDPEAFDAWLRRILVNACRAQMRVRRRVREIRLDATVDPAAPGPGLSEQLGATDLLARAFDRLDADKAGPPRPAPPGTRLDLADRGVARDPNRNGQVAPARRPPGTATGARRRRGGPAMTDQSRLQLTDTLLEQMLAQRAGPGAAADLIPSIAAAVESTGQWAPGPLGALSGRGASRSRRGPRRTWLLVAATLLVGAGVVGASLIGGGFVTPDPAPTMPVAITNQTAVPSRASSWAATGSMLTPRSGHTATLLPDGKVLVAGGESGSASAELYDPSTGSWTATGSMTAPRIHHTATLLPDGKVLVAGGYWVSDAERVGLASVELYDPSTGSWTATGSMDTPRFLHTATLLPDGRVLVAGGDSGSVTLASAELYDPSTGSWAATGSMHEGRAAHAAVLMSDGRVLVAGGADFHPDTQVDIASAELYDIGTGS